MAVEPFLPETTRGDFGFFDRTEGSVRVRKDGELQQQLQLRPVQSFAARTKHPSHQRINLLPQQRVLPAGLFQGGLQRDDEFAQRGKFGRRRRGVHGRKL
jgi:hypothetical protein